MLSEVPAGWGHCVVSDVADVIMGQSPKSADVNDTGIGLPFLQGCAEFGIKYPRYSAWVETPIKEALPDDILFSVRAPVGKQNIAKERVCIGRGLCAIRCRTIEQQFLSALLQHQVGFLLSQSQGSTFQAINKSQLESLLLAVPPLPEQKRIAEILSSVDESIQATQSVIDQAERVKRGLMEDLLTGGLGSEAIARGEVPEGWELLPMAELLALEYGKSLPQAKRDGGSYPVYGSSGIVGSHSKALIDGPTIIVGRKGSVGSVFSVSGPCYPIDTTYYVVPKKEFDWSWLASMLEHSDLLRLNEATGVPGLNRDSAYRQKIALPPLPEQNRIAEILSSVDEFIQSQKQIIEQYQVTKKGLMDDLLTGKVRTV